MKTMWGGLAPILLVALTACGGGNKPAGPHLAITPVKLGGEHAELLRTAFGQMQGYQLRYEGPRRGYNIVVETWSKGKLAASQTLGGGIFEPGVDMLCGLMTLDPHREGSATEMTLVMSAGGFSYRRNVVLEAWDRLEGEQLGTTFIVWRKPTHAPLVDGEPVALWRWNRSNSVLVDPLSSKLPKNANGLQISITLTK